MKKKNRSISIVLSLLFVTILSVRVFALDDELLDKAVKEYLRGDYIGAIADFERVLEMGENDKASRLLYKSIVEEGLRKYDNGQFLAAKEYYNKAAGLKPSDPDVKSKLDDIDKKLGINKKKKTATDEAVGQLKRQVSRERSQKNSYINRANKLANQKDELSTTLEDYRTKLTTSEQKIEDLAKIAKKRQTILIILLIVGGGVFIVFAVVLTITLIKVYSGYNASHYQLDELEEKFSQRLQDASKEGEVLEERVAKSINNMVSGQKDLVKQISLSASGKAQQDIELIKDKLEQNFAEQQERLLDLLAQQARSLTVEKTEKVEVNDRVITDVNPHVRARADSVELIPKTVTDPNIAEKMLRPYLTDANNRVRANACVAIHQYNPDMAKETLERMASNSDKWMRLSCAWAIGTIASPDLVSILRKLLDDVDERVKDRAVRAFENMANVKEDVSKEIRNMINKNRNSTSEDL